MGKSNFLVVISIILLTFLSSCAKKTTKVGVNSSNSKSNLALVKERGYLICGVNGQLPGFSFVNEKGEYSGLDTDICRAIAAALFDDPNKVEFRNLSAQERFTAVQAGEVDILSRNTTWTLSRDTDAGLEFAPVVFYDGQGMMVKQSSKIKQVADLQNKSICVLAGTTSAANLADQMGKRAINYNPVISNDTDAVYAAYQQGRCDAVTADRSQLIARRSNLASPQEHVILNTVLSKEPLAPAIAAGDAAWLDVVRWSIFTLIQAEEFGINSDNLSSFETTEDPAIKRFLGLQESLGEDLGLTNDFANRIINHVGNYEEIYQRNIGIPFQLERGQNELWTMGGLIYSPPFR